MTRMAEKKKIKIPLTVSVERILKNLNPVIIRLSSWNLRSKVAVNGDLPL
jgi:hypothetical protein